MNRTILNHNYLMTLPPAKPYGGRKMGSYDDEGFDESIESNAKLKLSHNAIAAAAAVHLGHNRGPNASDDNSTIESESTRGPANARRGSGRGLVSRGSGNGSRRRLVKRVIDNGRGAGRGGRGAGRGSPRGGGAAGGRGPFRAANGRGSPRGSTRGSGRGTGRAGGRGSRRAVPEEDSEGDPDDDPVDYSDVNTTTEEESVEPVVEISGDKPEEEDSVVRNNNNDNNHHNHSTGTPDRRSYTKRVVSNLSLESDIRSMTSTPSLDSAPCQPTPHRRPMKLRMTRADSRSVISYCRSVHTVTERDDNDNNTERTEPPSNSTLSNSNSGNGAFLKLQVDYLLGPYSEMVLDTFLLMNLGEEGNREARCELRHTDIVANIYKTMQSNIETSSRLLCKCCTFMMDLTHQNDPFNGGGGDSSGGGGGGHGHDNDDRYFKDRLLSVGAIEAIFLAMKQFPADEAMQIDGCGALANLFFMSHSSEKTRFVDNGGVEMVLGAMRRYQGNKDLQWNGCSFLRNIIAGDPATTKRLASKDAIDLVLETMGRYKRDEVIQECSCYFLLWMSSDNPDVKDRIIANGGGIQLAQLEFYFKGRNEDIESIARELLKTLYSG